MKTQRIVVCGGGLAGFSAAVTALEAGAEVTLVEKAPQPGGTTVLSGGLLWTFADYDKVREMIPAGDPSLQWLVLDNFDESRTWLAAMGAKFEDYGQVFGNGRGFSMDPGELISVLAARFAALGGTLHLETSLHSLLTSEGAISGIRTLRDGRLSELPASAVVLATGGFQGNPELLARYVVRDPDSLLLRANYWSTGDAFVAATDIGAAASPGLDTFYGHALAAPPARITHLHFRNAAQYQGQLAVAINMNGERFADETDSTGEEVLNQRLAQQPGGLGFYIMDHELMEQQPMQNRGSLIRVILESSRSIGAAVIEGSTLDELCKGMAKHGVPEGRALATLNTFNTAIENGRADELLPSRLRNRRPLRSAPFRAVAVKAGITMTMGGLAVDDRTRVLWRSGTTSHYGPVPVERAYVQNDGGGIAIGDHYRQMPIRGLYAAGNDAGNMSHLGYMGGLACALTTGRTAGRQAAALCLTAKK